MLRRLSAIFLGLSTPESYSCDEFVEQTTTTSAMALCGQFAFADADSSAASTPRPDKSQYTLFNPTPIDLRRPYNTDRPSKTDSPFTIDAGVFQIESDVANWTLDYEKGVGTRTWIIAIGIGLSMNAPPVRPLRPCHCTRAEFPLKTGSHDSAFIGFLQQPNSSRIRPKIWLFLLKHPNIGPKSR